MIYFCNDRVRGIDNKEQAVYLKIFAEFRYFLKEFETGNDLKTFMNIALHSDNQGWADISMSQIMSETGISDRNSIISAVKRLLTIRIKGERILARIKIRDHATHKFKQTKYLIFPTLKDLDMIETPVQESLFSSETEEKPCIEKPCMAEPCMENQYSMEEPLMEDISVANNGNVVMSSGAGDLPPNDVVMGEALADFWENPKKPMSEKDKTLMAKAFAFSEKRKREAQPAQLILEALRRAAVKHKFGCNWGNQIIKDAIKEAGERGAAPELVASRLAGFVEAGRKKVPGAWGFIPPEVAAQQILMELELNMPSERERVAQSMVDPIKKKANYSDMVLK